MPNREMTPADWAIKGELFLNCSCDVFCPCVVSLGAHLPTEGHCHAWMGIVIDEGHFEGEDLAGLNVGLLVDIPGRMGEGNWKVAAYVDDRASEAAYDGLLQIFSGAAGGLRLCCQSGELSCVVASSCLKNGGQASCSRSCQP